MVTVRACGWRRHFVHAAESVRRNGAASAAEPSSAAKEAAPSMSWRGPYDALVVLGTRASVHHQLAPLLMGRVVIAVVADERRALFEHVQITLIDLVELLSAGGESAAAAGRACRGAHAVGVRSATAVRKSVGPAAHRRWADARCREVAAAAEQRSAARRVVEAHRNDRRHQRLVELNNGALNTRSGACSVHYGKRAACHAHPAGRRIANANESGGRREGGGGVV